MNRVCVIAGTSSAAYSALLERRNAFLTPDEILIPACIATGGPVTGQELAERVAVRICDQVKIRTDLRYTDTTVITLLFSAPPALSLSFRQWMDFAYTVETGFDAQLQKVSGSRASELTRVCQAALAQARKAVNAVQDEVQSRDSQTPLLLPQLNFRNSSLREFVLSLPSKLQFGEDHHRLLKSEMNNFAKILTIEKEEESRNTVFVDERRVHFRAPGKAGPRHGSPSVASPHTKLCYLRGHFRLGAAYHSRFHYDCTKDGGKRLKGTFFDCHAAQSSWTGNPHLNIAPNDFVRA